MSSSVNAAGPSVGAILRREREMLGFSQDDIAAALGITQACLSHYETGKREELPLFVTWAWCGSLGLSLESVLLVASEAREVAA